MNRSFNQFSIVNTYGAFGSVGKVRHEIIIEVLGSPSLPPSLPSPSRPRALSPVVNFAARPVTRTVALALA
jgi:hypothetical protein